MLAFNGVDWGLPSPPSGVFFASLPPTAPLNLVKVSSTQTSATIGWSLPSFNGGSPVLGYLVYSNGGSDTTFTQVFNATSNSTLNFAHNNLTSIGSTFGY